MTPVDGFAIHEAEQLERWRQRTPQERLRWLDEAKQFVAKVEKARRPREGG